MIRKFYAVALLMIISFFFNNLCLSQVKNNIMQKGSHVYQISFSDETSLNLYSFYLHLIYKGNKEFKIHTNREPYVNLVKSNTTFFKRFIFSFRPRYKQAILWGKGTVENDTFFVENNSTLSVLRNTSFSFTINKDGELHGDLIFNENSLDIPNGKVQFVGKPKTYIEPIIDYKKLSTDLISNIKNNVYNPSILESSEGKQFLNELVAIGKTSNDDLDYLLSFFFIAQNYSPLSHFGIQKFSGELFPSTDSDKKNFDQLLDENRINYNFESNFAYINFNYFELSDTLIQQKFINECKAKDIDNLIIDLRDCLGGDFSSIKFAEYFINQESTVGYFLGKKYYQQHPNGDIDTVDLAKTETFNGQSIQEFNEFILEHGVLKGVAIPKSYINFDHIYVLISNQTASSAEPFSWFLKENTNAILIGENTAGKMLHSWPIKLEDNWVLTLPVADFITGDYKELEGVGVSPNVSMDSSKAFEYVIYLLDNSK